MRISTGTYRKGSIVEVTCKTPSDFREFKRLAHLDGCAETTDGGFRILKPSRFLSLASAIGNVEVRFT